MTTDHGIFSLLWQQHTGIGKRGRVDRSPALVGTASPAPGRKA